MLLSRVAENLYWISRYIERTENVARLLDVGFYLELDASSLNEADAEEGPITSVLTILACRDAFERTAGDGPDGRDRQAILRFLTFERANSHSITAMLGRARENARGTQETLSGEAWSQINKLYLYLCSPRAQRRFSTSPTRFYDGITRACILFDGLVDSTLPRSEVYHFLQLGRHLERVNQIARILSIKMHGLRDGGPVIDPPMRVVHWQSLLRCCSAYSAYLREHHDRIDPEGVVHYLVLDPDFPRSMRFGIERCCESIREISGSLGDAYTSEAERHLGRIQSDLRYVDVDEIFHQGLEPFLSRIQEACNRVGDEIHQAYFFT